MSIIHHQTLDWGFVPYEVGLLRQQAWVQERIAGTQPDRLVFVEHPSVYTLGLRMQAQDHLLWTDEERKARGVGVAKTNRGGDVTYHGPGQLVAYPIISLEAKKDLHLYLRFLEDVLIQVCAYFKLSASRISGKTGIWIENRKIAAIGVAAKQWVTYHGFALNISTDLSYFEGIVPCGIPRNEGSVTSLEKELGCCVDNNEVKDRVSQYFWDHWQQLNSTFTGTSFFMQ